MPKFQFSPKTLRTKTNKNYSQVTNNDPVEDQGAPTLQELKCSTNTLNSKFKRRKRQISTVHEGEEAATLSESEGRIITSTSPLFTRASSKNNSKHTENTYKQLHCSNNIANYMAHELEIHPESCSNIVETPEKCFKSQLHAVQILKEKSDIGK